MTAAAVKEPSTSIVALVEATPVLVLTDKAKFGEFYEAIREECQAHKPDLTTERGRKAIASLAYKVARTKTAIDAAGKQLNEEARARINAVDAARREIRQQLDTLQDEVRKPLTDWEEAEEARKAEAQRQMSEMREMSRVDIADTAETVLDRIQRLETLEIREDLHQSGHDLALSTQASALDTLRDAHARLVREEDERTELARLRAAEAERLAKEQAEQEAREAKERAEAEAKAAEDRRIAAEKAEAERIARAKEEAAEAARKEAERAKQAEIDAANERARQAEAEAQRQRDEAEAAERARIAEAEREAAELRRREADRAHRGKIMGEAKAAIMSCGVEEAVAKAIVLAIAAKNVPHIVIQF